MPTARLQVIDLRDDETIISGTLTIDGTTTEFKAASGDYHPVYAALKARGYRFADRYDDPNDSIDIDEQKLAEFDVEALDLRYFMAKQLIREALETLFVAGVTPAMYAEYLTTATAR